MDLNESQEAVLRWVADGCPPGIMEGYSHRISAAAPRSRSLVRISGRGKTWRAELAQAPPARRAAGEKERPVSEHPGRVSQDGRQLL